MNTHIRNEDSPETPGNKVLVFDSETGTVQDPASVHDRASYYRYMMMLARSAGGNRDGREDAAPARNAGQ